MNPVRVWLGIYTAGFAVLTALLIVTLLTPPPYPYGALTRIGRVSEYEFGWRSSPPPIPAEQVRSVPLDQADVMVIGDSFSMYYAWQSPLVGAGYRVAGAHWDKIGPLCDDFASWLRHEGFKGKLVLIESIERLLPERLDAARGCRSMRGSFVAMPAPGASPSQPAPGFALNWESTLLTGLYTWRNTREIRRSNTEFVVDHPKHGDMIFAAPVPDGCAQFSHRMCDKGLFLTDDRNNAELTAKDADFMHRFNTLAAPLKVVWMVIPNKTTVYLDPGHAQAFVQRVNELQVGPDLFAMAQDMRRKMVDLYWSNDTHWSMQGQLYFGQRMLALTQAAIGNPATEGRP
jgi:predicted nuclease of predicted toxin-antitoxin system